MKDLQNAKKPSTSTSKNTESETQPAPLASYDSLTSKNILYLQRTIGNRATLSLIQPPNKQRGTVIQPKVQKVIQRDDDDISVSCLSGNPTVQRKPGPDAAGKAAIDLNSKVIYDVKSQQNGKYLLQWRYRSVNANGYPDIPDVDPDDDRYQLINQPHFQSNALIPLEEPEEDESEAQPAEFPWQTLVPALGNSYEDRLQAFHINAKNFIKHVYTVTPEELGEKSLKAWMQDMLKGKDQEEDISQVEEDEDAPVMLEEEEEVSQLAPSKKSSKKGKSDQQDNILADTESGSKDLLSRMVQAAEAKVGSGDDKRTQLMRVTIRLAESCLRELLAEHKTWKNVFLHLGATGIAGFFEDLLSKVTDHMDKHIKELVPMSKARENKLTATKVGEGATDVTYNIVGFAAEAIFTPLTNFGTAALGGTYKGGFASSKAKLGGADKEKAALVGGVTAILEFLQGLIPYYGSIIGITSGAENVASSLKLKKRMKSLASGHTYSKANAQAQGHPRVLELLDKRIDHCRMLLETGQKYKDKTSQGLYKELLEISKFLRRQYDKSQKRQAAVKEKGKASLLSDAADTD